MATLAVVTGATSGIGEHLALALARAGVMVIASGRREVASVAAASSNITPVCADITTQEGVAAVQAAVERTGLPLRLLVQNAGVLGPVCPLTAYPPGDWQGVMDTNVNGPLRLAQALLPHMPAGGRVLHISSGAAHSPIAGWGGYCVSKAAFHMLAQVLRVEHAGRGVLVGSARPGVVDTAMQAAIREGDAGGFPDKPRFVALHHGRVALDEGGGGGGGLQGAPAPPPAGALDTPANVAAFLRRVLLEAGDDEFVQGGVGGVGGSGREWEWDIRDGSHHHRWARAWGVSLGRGPGA